MRWVKDSLATHFKMKNLGKLHYCLGITIEYGEVFVDVPKAVYSLIAGKIWTISSKNIHNSS